jgi:hypothetical protein
MLIFLLFVSACVLLHTGGWINVLNSTLTVHFRMLTNNGEWNIFPSKISLLVLCRVLLLWHQWRLFWCSRSKESKQDYGSQNWNFRYRSILKAVFFVLSALKGLTIELYHKSLTHTIIFFLKFSSPIIV